MKDAKKQAEKLSETMLPPLKGEDFHRNIFIVAYLKGFKDATEWKNPNEKPKKELTINGEVLAQSENRIYFGIYIKNKWHTFYEGKWREDEIIGWIYLPKLKTK